MSLSAARTSLHLPLQWGECSLLQSPSEERSRRRRRTRTDTTRSPQYASFATHTLLAVFSSNGNQNNSPTIVLCKWAPTSIECISHDTEPETIICLDDSVRVLIRNDPSFDGGLPVTLDPRRNRNIVPWKKVITKKTDSIVQRGCGEGIHLHLMVAPLDERPSSDNAQERFQQDFFAHVTNVPSPLLSISLSRIRGLSSDNALSSEAAKAKDILQQACHKRQLMGSVLMFDDRRVDCNVTTAFSMISSDGERQQYEVTSILPQQTQSDKDSSMYIILPSTRITFLDEVDTSHASTAQHFQVDASAREMSSSKTTLSSAASLLVHTIRCTQSLAAAKHTNIPRSFLLTGPPGVGKTHAVRTALMEVEKEHPKTTHLLSRQGSELLGGSGGSNDAEASRELEQHFLKAAQFCCQGQRCVAVVFLDECEALLSSEAVAAMLGNLLDRVSSSTSSKGWRRMLVVGATNRIDAVPGWLRRPGRFDREVVMTPPNTQDRVEVLESLLFQRRQQQEQQVGMELSADYKSDMEANDESLPTADTTNTTIKRQDLVVVAEACVGYVAADLAALVRRAALLGIYEQTHNITADLLMRAMDDVGASALRDAALAAPATTRWDDIAGDAGGAKSALRRAVEWPRTKRAAYASLGLVPPRGILLHGPPGCAKTTLARAAAGASGIAFFSLSPADVYASSYVGEAEAIVRRAFTLARSAAPCILFFDEIDSILGSSTGSSGLNGRGSTAEARVLSTFLNEMDGVDGSRTDGVLVLGATNRPCTLDAALLRPGRFDKVIYVPPPDEEGRKSILSLQIKKWTTSNDTTGVIDIDMLASDSVTGQMTGAEIVGACREAAMKTLREALNKNKKGDRQIYEKMEPSVTHKCLEESLKAVKPLLSNETVLQEYLQFEKPRQSQ